MKSPSETNHEALVDGKLRLAVDWDGTCVENKWPEKAGNWLPGAIDALRELSEHFHILIHTCRVAPVGPDQETPHDWEAEVDDIRKRLDEEGLTMVEVHTKPWKPSAVAYIDDRAIPYTGSWTQVLATISNGNGSLTTARAKAGHK